MENGTLVESESLHLTHQSVEDVGCVAEAAVGTTGVEGGVVGFVGGGGVSEGG